MSPDAQPGAPRLVKLFNVIDGTLQLDAVPGLRNLPSGHSIVIPEILLSNQLIISCMQQGWLVPEGHPAIPQTRAQQRSAPVAHPGSQAEATFQMPFPPGVNQGQYGVQPNQYPGQYGVQLPGMVNRQGNPEVMDSPVGVADAASIITGGRSRPDAEVLVPDADSVMRMGMRGQNVIIPGQPANPNFNIPVMPQDSGVPLAGGILASQNPLYPQHNTIVGPPTGQPMQPGAFSRPMQGPPMANSPTMPWAQPQMPQAQPGMQPFVQTPPGVTGGMPPQLQGGQFVPNNMPRSGTFQHRGIYPSFQSYQTPPQPSPIPPGGTMGQLIVPGATYGQAGVMEIENTVLSAGRGDLFENTERVLQNVAQGNREASLIANYKEWPLQKRWDFICRTQDLALLYRFYSMEVMAPEDRRNNDMILGLQNIIARFNGQVPDVNQVRAMQMPQQQPAQAVLTPVSQALMEYPDWDDARKQAFVANLKDTELLGRLLKREINPANQQLIQSQIAQLNTLAQQAAAQRAQGQPTPIPPQEPPFMQPVVQGAVVDKVLQPPPPPQPQFVQPVQAPQPQPQVQFVQPAAQPGDTIVMPQPRPQG